MLSVGAIDKKYIKDSELIQKISNFLYSDYYFISLIILTTLLWGLGQITSGPMIVLALSLMLLIIAFVVIIQRDIKPVLPLIFFTMFGLSSPSLPSYIWVVAIPGVIVALAAAFHIYYYKLEEFKFGKLFSPMVLFFITMLLGGIGSRFPQNTKGILMGALIIGIVPLFVYSITMNYRDDEKSIREYIAKTALYFGLAMVIHLAIYYIFKPESLRALASVPHLGYGISNTIATYFLITGPMGFYLYAKSNPKKGYAYLLMAIAEFVSIVLTTSRGGTLFGLIEFLITAIVTIFAVDKKKRIEYLVFALIMFVLAGICFAIMFRKVINFITYIFNDGMQDSGRFELYREALARFFEYPIFGVGMGYIGNNKILFNTLGTYMFHNTILQYAACLGIVGFTAYAYLYWSRLEIIFEKWDLYTLYIVMAFIGFEGYSLLNTGTIQGYPTAILITVLYAAHEVETKQQESVIYIKLKNKLKKNDKIIKSTQSVQEV